MYRKITFASIFFILTMSFLFSAMAIEAGNARRGKYLFRKNCRTCHIEDATAENAGKPLSPISKTQADWSKVFADYQNLPCADNWKEFNTKRMEDLYAHLWGHAFDSPSPAKCQ